MTDIRVPDLGESIIEATILQWYKQAGEAVAEGDAVAELETDKVNVEVIADASGTLQTILKQAGDTVAPGEVIGQIGAGVSPTNPSVPVVAAAPTAPAPVAAPAASPAQVASVAAVGGSSAVIASPAVRKLAREQGVDLNQLAGGAFGRVTGQAVLTRPAASPGPSATTAAPPQAGPVAGERPDEVRTPMSRRRQTIARRLVEVQHTAAMLTTFNEIDMTNVMAIRSRRKDSFKEEHGVSLGFMSFFTKATVAALKAFPLLNAEIQGDVIVEKRHYDIGVAVAAEGGLVVPVVRDADSLSFAEIEREIGRMAKAARANTLAVKDLTGGTFTITNGGVFGSLFSTPILNAPQVGILGMHSIQQRPMAVGGEVQIRPMMYVALSYDHRIVDGAEAVQFLVRIKRLIEDPESLLIEG